MKQQENQVLNQLPTNSAADSNYDIYPLYPADGIIYKGYPAIADAILTYPLHILEGYIGVNWEEVVANIKHHIVDKGKTVSFTPVTTYLKSANTIEEIVSPYLGGNDPVFGRKTSLRLPDFFEMGDLGELSTESDTDIHIIYGCGAALCNWDAPITYIDLPKYELQLRMRNDEVYNLGALHLTDQKATYKRFYFVDWVILNEHKRTLLPKVTRIADQQWQGTITWMDGDSLRKTLSNMSRTYFRVRPWFEPGVWGGDWMLNRFEKLNKDVPNYAWSFEMIVPENGLLLSDGNNWLEVSFDMLMYLQHERILGKASNRFGYEFPIRFDFLDTFNGGNLSIQCHPTPEYIYHEFGENFTQDETYYIIDSAPDAVVYLGFQQGIEPTEFKEALIKSYEYNIELDVDNYIQHFPSRRHDLFLIPHGTVHSSGKNNLVLEISATPYIFTFKMYDWQRLDLDGHARPLNIDRAMDNLDFTRQGQVVRDTLIAKSRQVDEGKDWLLMHLPTHPKHFYDIYRYEFDTSFTAFTNGQCHILMLVEGTSIELKLANDMCVTFHYAETFAIPAAAEQYTLVNRGNNRAKVVVAFVKDEACLD
ncbi:class I mannose-6-phosphate isomerase [Parapedobacter sp. DT-150]|uniref:class I mannose-6-phosphate isomerase n=1 Tax=Parapedobacter sp. DT-150 TaxID=3396162 RepID=UPI003F1C98A4